MAQLRKTNTHHFNYINATTSMPNPQTLLSPANTHCNLRVTSKKALLEHIAKSLQEELGNECWETIFDALVAREKYGTTGFGKGIAIPHCRLESCHQATAFFAKLNPAIEFDAVDNDPVDLVFTLVVPSEANEEHLNILSRLASILDNNASRIALRDAPSHTELFKRMDKMLSSKL